MNTILALIAITLLSYLVGALPTAYLIARFIHRINIFEIGSGNMGGTNVARAMGLGWGILTVLVDICKGMTAVWLAQQIMPKTLPHATLAASIIAAVFAVAGHNWSIFATGLYTHYQKQFRIRGGKGAATAFGTMIMILPPVPVILVLVVGLVLALLTRYASLSVLVSFAAALAWTAIWALEGGLESHRALFVPYALGIAALIIWRFRENMQRLITGTERRIGERA